MPFKDQGDSSGYIAMEKRNEEGVYVKVQRDDGSYCYVLKEDQDIYTDVDGNNENEDGEYYVKMRRENGGHYYLPMKEGVCKPKFTGTTKQGYVNIAEQSDPHDEENVYSNLGQDDLSSGNIDQDGQELYEDMARDTTSHHEPFYEDMNPEDKDQPASEELYMEMLPEDTEDVPELYIQMAGGLLKKKNSNTI